MNQNFKKILGFGVLGQTDSIQSNGCNFPGDVPVLAQASVISGHRGECCFWQPRLPWQGKMILRSVLLVLHPPSSPHVPPRFPVSSLSPPASCLLPFSRPVQRADLAKICQEEGKKEKKKKKKTVGALFGPLPPNRSLHSRRGGGAACRQAAA